MWKFKVEQTIPGMVGVMCCALMAAPAAAETPDGAGLFAMPPNAVSTVKSAAPSYSSGAPTLGWLFREVQSSSTRRIEAAPLIFGFFDGFGLMVRGRM